MLRPRADPSERLPLAAVRAPFQAGSVQVIFLALSGLAAAAMERALPADDRARGERLVAPDARRGFAAGRWLTRCVLGALTGGEPGALELRAGEHGKLFLGGFKAIAPSFNLSHSGELAALALMRERRVGVDIEAERAFSDMGLLARRILGPRERAAFEALPEAARAAALLAAWTRKEAVLKAMGTGIAGNLRSIEVLQEASAESRDELVAQSTNPPIRWSVRALSLPPGYQGSIAVEGDGCPLVPWQAVTSGLI